MVCDPHYKEDFLHRYELEKMTSQDDIEFHLTDLDDYSGVIESYELNQRGNISGQLSLERKLLVIKGITIHK